MKGFLEVSHRAPQKNKREIFWVAWFYKQATPDGVSKMEN